MKTLVVGMQSSGASFVTFCLAQPPATIAVVDLYCQEHAPRLDEEARQFDVIVKCTITATIPLSRQIERFRPDRLILVSRNIDDVRRSLRTKPYRDQAGAMEEKIAVYRELLLRQLGRFDEVISYERFTRRLVPISRRKNEIVAFNAAHSAWCRENYGKKWGFGGLRV